MSSSLQQKLSGFEATPPTGMWDRIADALDAEESFPKRLLQYEETPPARVWNAVEASLGSNDSGAKVVPLFSKKVFRYMAAASLIAAVLVAVTLLIRRPETGSLAGTQKPTLPETSKPSDSSPVQNDRAGTEETAFTGAEKRNPERTQTTVGRRLLGFIRPQNTWRTSAITHHFIPKKAIEKNLLDFSLLENFMVYSDNDGNVMRLPKKLFSLVNCEDGDGSCKERIHRLQEKLSANNASPDFFGMLDQLRQLQ